MVSLSILQTHEPKSLRKFITEANKGIRAKISAEIKEERKKFSKEMSEKRKMEKEKRIIQIPKKAKKEDLIKVIMDNKKHFKDIKKNVSKDDKIKELDNLIKNETNKISSMNASELNELSKKYMNFKELVGLNNKKHKGIVKAILKRQQELKKPKAKIPTIKITEAEEEKGGGAAYPKSKLPPIPKPTAKIRIVPKKPKAQLGQSGIGNKRKREPPKPRKKKIIDVYVKPNEEKAKPKAKAKIPTITITEEEKPKKKVIKVGGRFITPKPKAEPKSTLPPIAKKNIKIRLPKEEKPKEKKEDFKFEKKYLKIESKKAGSLERYEIEYDNEKENSYIEITLTKRAKTILMIDTLSSQFDADRPRARKGYTRAMLCHVINMLLNKNMIELKDKVELIAGNIGGIKGGKKHNLINLVKMYENMGFKEYAQTKGQRNLESTVEKVLKWCDDKYNIKPKPAPKPEPETESEEEPDEIPYKDFKLIEGVPKNIKKIFYDYVDDRTGYANKNNQEGEIEELQRIEKNYIEAEATRKNKTLSAKKQLKAVQTIGSILIEVRNDINDNPDIKKLYKVYTPIILKRVLDQKKKDEADLKKEAEEIKKQQKADEKEFKKSLKDDKSKKSK